MGKYILILALAVGLEAQTVFCTTRDRHLTVRNCQCPAPAAGQPPMVRIVRVTTTNRVGYRCIPQCSFPAATGQSNSAASTDSRCGCGDSRVRVTETQTSGATGYRCKIPCTEQSDRLTTLDCGCKAGYDKKSGQTKAGESGYRCERQDMGEFTEKVNLPFIGDVPVRMLAVGGGALFVILCLLAVMCSYKSKYDEMLLNLDSTVVDTEDLPEPDFEAMAPDTPRDPRLQKMLSSKGESLGRKSIIQLQNTMSTMPTITSTEGEEGFQQFVDNLKGIGFFKNFEPGSNAYEARMEKVKERWKLKTGG